MIAELVLSLAVEVPPIPGLPLAQGLAIGRVVRLAGYPVGPVVVDTRERQADGTFRYGLFDPVYRRCVGWERGERGVAPIPPYIARDQLTPLPK